MHLDYRAHPEDRDVPWRTVTLMHKIMWWLSHNGSIHKRSRLHGHTVSSRTVIINRSFRWPDTWGLNQQNGILHISKYINFHTFWKSLLDYCCRGRIVWSSSVDKRDVGLLTDDWGRTCPSPGRHSAAAQIWMGQGCSQHLASSPVYLFDKPTSRLIQENKLHWKNNICFSIQR